MSVDANARLIYGFFDDCQEMSDLFSLIREKGDTGYPFSEMHDELQTKHKVWLNCICGEVDMLSAYSCCVGRKGFDSTTIPAEALSNTEEYDKRIAAFLTDLGINPANYKPAWHLMSYMD